ncbi:hypothetical protein AGMMS50262_23030 [Bacteroidia bacterium]|nr:hypothetical protein AGMMS50262_23030 [Bacteroidia bacterium]
MEKIVFSKYSVDFARAAWEYCVLMEKAKESDKKTFVDNLTKVLPLLYLKASIIPEIKENYDSVLETKVDETFYSQVETQVSGLLGDDNLYLETFHPDIKLSDSPVAVKTSTISPSSGIILTRLIAPENTQG